MSFEIWVVIGTGFSIVLTVLLISRLIRKEVQCIVDKKADKIEVKKEIEKIDIKIKNLTTLYEINGTKIDKVDAKLDNIPLMIDAKLNDQFDRMVQIIKK